ncbi:hypothetical protein PR003_g9884 [Phytophthora rubi]|uniref:Uncharacterized protein n=1 Tax=Phytophthora rubi TaxID=129364 RepID=A0A6A3MPJ3_9STRA|nr:hypothetical protein PR001_g9499 [Phytophthora rubi]KAE9341644.1 hypothetical protein PR003_g9884 [Phytophthora rubi]
MALFQPGLASDARPPARARVEPSPAAPSSRIPYEMQLLRGELDNLRGQVAGVRQSLAVIIDPNDHGALPAYAIRQLTSASCSDQAKKVKGDYRSSQTPLLATEMFKRITPSEGKPVSPMSFVLDLREAESAGFKTSQQRSWLFSHGDWTLEG